MDQLRALARTLRIEAHAVWLTARHPDTPWLARLLGMVIAAYALSPIDLIPDFIPILGVLDEAVLIPLGIWLFLKLVPDQLYADKLGRGCGNRGPLDRAYRAHCPIALAITNTLPSLARRYVGQSNLPRQAQYRCAICRR